MSRIPLNLVSAGPVSRNLVADGHGRAYVPRVAARSLAHDPGTQEPANNHGIVGLAYLADGRILFTTHLGHLYAVDPKPGAAATVTALGWFHPQGEAYAPSLFSFSGKELLAGVTVREGRYEWVVRDLDKRHASAYRLETFGLQSVLLYGSVTRDNDGRFYVGGWARGANGRSRPLVLQIAAAP